MADTPTAQAPLQRVELTLKISQLARLELSAAEVELFTPQLGDVLSYMTQLQGVDVTGVEPLTHPFALETALREDVVVPTRLDAEQTPLVLASAPETLHGGYKVPPVL